MTGRHRRVRGENGRATHLGEGRVEIVPGVEELADALKDDERGVALVEMVHSG